MSVKNILMPALSPTMEEGTLSKWLVKIGEKISPGDLIAEIETDKATMEIESVDEGFLSKILFKEGSEGIKVNTPIAEIQEEKVLDAKSLDLESNIVKLTDNLNIEKDLVSNKKMDDNKNLNNSDNKIFKKNYS